MHSHGTIILIGSQYLWWIFVYTAAFNAAIWKKSDKS